MPDMTSSYGRNPGLIGSEKLPVSKKKHKNQTLTECVSNQYSDFDIFRYDHKLENIYNSNLKVVLDRAHQYLKFCL